MKRYSVLAGTVIDFPQRKVPLVVEAEPAEDLTLKAMNDMAEQIKQLSQMVQDMAAVRTSELNVIRDTIMEGLKSIQPQAIAASDPVDLTPVIEQMQSLFSTALQRIDNVVTRVSDVGRAVEANTQAIKQIPAGPTEIAFDIKRDAAGKPLAVIARSNQ